MFSELFFPFAWYEISAFSLNYFPIPDILFFKANEPGRVTATRQIYCQTKNNARDAAIRRKILAAYAGRAAFPKGLADVFTKKKKTSGCKSERAKAKRKSNILKPSPLLAMGGRFQGRERAKFSPEMNFRFRKICLLLRENNVIICVITLVSILSFGDGEKNCTDSGLNGISLL